MERIDKIFVILVALAVVVFLIKKATPRKIDDMKVPNGRVMQSVRTLSHLVGPAYLTSNLPSYRVSDDTVPSVSLGPGDATATGATAV